MTRQKFIEGIRTQVIEANLNAYRDLFDAAQGEHVTDPYWQRVGPFYASLDANQRDTLFTILRQVEVDTVSGFLAILDGVKVIDPKEGDFVLTTEADQAKINGDLQAIFLEPEYE